MRRYSVSAVLGAVFFMMVFCAVSHAASVEFHGGLYTSYEYTDNYLGTAHDEEGESIYEIGPSASILSQTSTMSLDLSGHAARSFHQKFDDDNFNEILLSSRLNSSSRTGEVDLTYAFSQTSRRSTLTDLRGNSKLHTGALNYSRLLTPATTLGLGYTYSQESNPSPDDDIVSHGVSGTLAHQLSQIHTVRGALGYNTHDYEIRDDAWEARSSLGFDTQVTSRSSIGIDAEYEHQEREELPGGDIYNAFLSWGYTLMPDTTTRLSAGYSWLSMEEQEREGNFAARGEITKRTEDDTFSVRISREYTSEFTEDRSGAYDARSIYASWERTLLRDLRLLSNITYEERKPVSGDELTFTVGEEKTFSGILSLNWTPLEYLSVRPSYEHMERRREIIDTVRENRYRIIAEVRY